MPSGREQGGFVNGISQVRPGKTGSRLGNSPEIHILGQRFAAGMDAQDGFPSINIWRINDDLPIESARPQERAIEHVRTIGGGQNDHTRVSGESVHFDEQLVERLFPFIVDRADVNTPLASDGIQLVNEHDTGGLGFGLLKQIANARGADTHEHLDKIAAAEREEGDVGFARHGFGQQGFSGPGRANEQNPFWDVGANRFIALRMFEKINHFLQLILGFLASSDIVESDASFLFRDEAGFALAEAQDGFAGAAEAPADK